MGGRFQSQQKIADPKGRKDSFVTNFLKNYQKKNNKSQGIRPMAGPKAINQGMNQEAEVNVRRRIPIPHGRARMLDLHL